MPEKSSSGQQRVQNFFHKISGTVGHNYYELDDEPPEGRADFVAIKKELAVFTETVESLRDSVIHPVVDEYSKCKSAHTYKWRNELVAKGKNSEEKIARLMAAGTVRPQLREQVGVQKEQFAEVSRWVKDDYEWWLATSNKPPSPRRAR